jgi:hypothetical protein
MGAAGGRYRGFQSHVGEDSQELRAPMLNAARDSGAEMRRGIRAMGDEAIKTMMAGSRASVRQAYRGPRRRAILADWRSRPKPSTPMRGKLFPLSCSMRSGGMRRVPGTFGWRRQVTSAARFLGKSERSGDSGDLAHVAARL